MLFFGLDRPPPSLLWCRQHGGVGKGGDPVAKKKAAKKKKK
jgi:hypothetical protein